MSGIRAYFREQVRDTTTGALLPRWLCDFVVFGLTFALLGTLIDAWKNW